MPEDPVDPETTPPAPEAEEPTYPSLEELSQLLPQYEIQEIIGIGGMGAVYRGRQIALDRSVAIKVMPAESAQNPEDVQRFIKEARAMAKLVHPHIVAVFDFGQTYARHLFLVMEYVDGCDLHRRTRRKEITIERAREVIAQLCDALQFAHDRGVAHRDIKPANILITNDWKVKVADFGLARDLSALPNPDEVEYGTPDYTAPERLIIGAEVDHRADIYALGVVIHEMLTGKTPTAAGKDAGKDLPPGFAGVISKCLMSEPEQRYQKANEVKVALLTATAAKALEQTSASSKQAPEAPPAGSHPQPQIPFESPESYTRYRPSLFARLGQKLAPLAWAAASILLLGFFAWIMLKDKVSIETPEAATVADKPAPTTPEVTPTPVGTPPAPATPQPAAPAPAPAAPTMATVKTTPPEPTQPAMPAPVQPYSVPEGAAGEVAKLDGHTAAVYAINLLSDQNRLISAGMDGSLRIWDLSSQKALITLDAGIDQISRIQVLPGEQQALIFGFRADKLALVDLTTGQITRTAQFPHERFVSAIWVPESQSIVLGGSGEDGTNNLFLWKPAEGEAVTPVTGFQGRVYGMTLLPDQKEVLITAAEITDPAKKLTRPAIHRFSPATGTLTPVEVGSLGYITRFYSTPGEAKSFVSGSTPKVLSLPDLSIVTSLPPLQREGPFPSTGLLVDGDRLLLTSWTDSTLRAYDVSSQEELWRQTTPEPVTHISLSKDQRWAVLSTRYKDSQNQQQGDFDLLIWRMPKWADLVSEQSLLAQIAPQMADLGKHDPELADLREKLLQRAALPSQTDLDAQRQKLDVQYIAALRRDYPRLSPTEQQAVKAELELIALQNGLPPAGMDVSLPAALQKLRSIYRQQLSSLENLHQEATKIAVQSAESVLSPLLQQRESRGDKLGALRVKSVLKIWQGAGKTPPSSGTSTTQGSTSPAAPKSGIAIGTATRRPDRQGSVIAIPRSQMNSSNIIGQPGVGLVPKDLGPVVALSGGASHIVALLPDGKLRGWGDSTPQIPKDLADVVQIDSTDTTLIALTSDGKVTAWNPTDATNPTTWTPTDGKAPVEVHAGMNTSGYIILSDGSLQPIGSVSASPPADLGPIKKLIHIPNRGWCALRERDGSPVFWGDSAPPVLPLPADLSDLISLSIASGFGVALQRDGTMTGWGQLASDQRYRIRKFTSATQVYHDYADRVFPVHRADHSWELAPNPNIPEYVAEDRTSVVEGRLRGAIDAVFGRQYVIALKP